MPQPLSKLQAEMTFNQDLAYVVDAMKGIAAAQYQVMERKLTSLKRFSETLEELFTVYDFRRSRHPFVRAKSDRKLFIVITTDSGFLGGLNMKVLQLTMKYRDPDSHFFVLGERGANYLKEFDIAHEAYPGIDINDTRFDLAKRLTRDILQHVIQGKAGRVFLVYPNSLSFMTQRIEALNLVPCPIFFKNRRSGVPTDASQARQIILESASSGIIEYLTSRWLNKRLIELFELAKLSEFGARTMHLEDSFQTLSKIEKGLKLEFFKARRAKIDQSIRESFTSQLICEEEAS